jgi:hypothetical protein
MHERHAPTGITPSLCCLRVSLAIQPRIDHAPLWQYFSRSPLAGGAGDSNPFGEGDAFGLFFLLPLLAEGSTAGVGVAGRARRRKIAPPLGVS